MTTDDLLDVLRDWKGAPSTNLNHRDERTFLVPDVVHQARFVDPHVTELEIDELVASLGGERLAHTHLNDIPKQLLLRLIGRKVAKHDAYVVPADMIEGPPT